MTFKDLAICEQVNKQWQEMIDNQYIWRKLNFQNQRGQSSNDKFVKYITNKLIKYKDSIHILNLQSLNFDQFYKVIQKNSFSNLRKFEVYFSHKLNDLQASLLALLIVKQCNNLLSFKTYSPFLTDENMEAFENLQNLQSFKIMCDDNSFQGKQLPCLPPLKRVFLRPYLINFEYLSQLIEKSKNSLESIGIDTECMEENQLLMLLNMLNPEIITNIQLNFCEKFSDNVLMKISTFKNLKKFQFYKSNSISNIEYFACFQKFQTTSLIDLNLKECNDVNDDSLIQIFKNNKNLKYLRLSWQKFISSISIKYLFENCGNQLEVCQFEGVKLLDQKAFPQIEDLLQYFDAQKYLETVIIPGNNSILFDSIQYLFSTQVSEQQITLYKRLKEIDCSRCDMVPDKILQILRCFRPNIIAKNYYGEQM